MTDVGHSIFGSGEGNVARAFNLASRRSRVVFSQRADRRRWRWTLDHGRRRGEGAMPTTVQHATFRWFLAICVALRRPLVLMQRRRHITHHKRQLRETRMRASCVRRTSEARMASGSGSRRWLPLSELWTVSLTFASLRLATLSAVCVAMCRTNASLPPRGCSIGGWSNLEVQSFPWYIFAASTPRLGVSEACSAVPRLSSVFALSHGTSLFPLSAMRPSWRLRLCCCGCFVLGDDPTE